jgi:hypothetical protein
MATNRVMADGYHLSVVCDNPTVPQTGDPVRFGYLTGVALTDEVEGGNPAGYTSVDFGPRVWKLSVKAIDGSGSSAVAVGDAIYYVDADTPKLSKKTAGYLFGIALETITGNATATIKVLKIPGPGSGAFGTGTVTASNLGAGAVETAKIAANAVTTAKLTATMGIGVYQLPLHAARIIASNDIGVKNATDGGAVSKDTTPIFERVNGATDKALRLRWAASDSAEIQLPTFAYPPDLDDAAAVEVHLLAAMAGATNTPVIAVSYFEGLGDTNAGGNTAAVTGTGIAEYTVTIAAGDVGAHPTFANIGLTPAAHTTDALYVYAAWIEYTRK